MRKPSRDGAHLLYAYVHVLHCGYLRFCRIGTVSRRFNSRRLSIQQEIPLEAVLCRIPTPVH